MKKLWKTSLCLMAATTLVSVAHAEEAQAEALKPCCENLGQCRWTSHELFAHVTGFESEPMSAMMEKLTPDNPELWDLYSDSIGNLLLANLFLGADKDIITNATYELRFHEEMTFAAAFAAFETSIYYPGCRIAEEDSKTVELFLHAMMMNSSIEELGLYLDSATFEPVVNALRYFGCLQSESTASTRASFSTEPYNPAHSFAEASLPLTCQATFSLFATKETAQVTWLDEEELAKMVEEFAGYADFFKAPKNYNLAQVLASFLPADEAEAVEVITESEITVEVALTETSEEVAEEEETIEVVTVTDEGLPVICAFECDDIPAETDEEMAL